MLRKLKFSEQIFEKSANTKFHKHPSSGNRVVSCGWTVGQTDRHDEGNSHFCAILRTRLIFEAVGDIQDDEEGNEDAWQQKEKQRN
jgi:hypothetical protein